MHLAAGGRISAAEVVLGKVLVKYTCLVILVSAACGVSISAHSNADAELPVRLVVQLGHAGAVNAAAISPDGRLVATASGDKTARVWDTATGKELLALTGNSDSILAISFSPDGRWIATGSEDGIAALWEVSTGKQVHRYSGSEIGKPLGWVFSVTFSHDGKTLLGAEGAGSVRFWDVKSGQELHRSTSRKSGGPFSLPMSATW